MHFDEALQYLLSLGHETLALKLGLRTTELLLHSLGNPQGFFPSVQIAGTNGKGSTAVVLESICQAGGIKTGLFTSPHLINITERIRIDGREISPAAFADVATEVRDGADQLVKAGDLEAPPTFFEQVTAIALLAFKRAGVELAILETGLGGRLDSTTAARAETIAITPIALDHQNYLGESLAEIAGEKAAIIRSGVTAIVARQSPEALEVILRRCSGVGVTPRHDGDWGDEEFEVQILSATADGRLQARFTTSEDSYQVTPRLRGRHQLANISLAIRLAESLRERGFQIPRSAIIHGVERAEHPGRLELKEGRPRILFDGAHNPAGAAALRDYLDEFVTQPITMVFGAMRDKNLEEMAQLLFPCADRLILTEPDNLRATAVETLREFAANIIGPQIITAEPSATKAISLAFEQTPAGDLVCVTGSLYLIGEIQNAIRQSKNKRDDPFEKQIMTESKRVAPRILNSKEVFRGRVFDVSTDTIREGDITYERDVVHHPGSAVIVPVFDDRTVALVRQYRHPAVRYLLEVPAGTLNRGEAPETGAARELEEELGLVAANMTKLAEFFVSPGFCEEKMWVFLATALSETAQRLDDDELIEVVRLPLARALEMVDTGEIEDAKTIVGLMLAATRIGS